MKLNIDISKLKNNKLINLCILSRGNYSRVVDFRHLALRKEREGMGEIRANDTYSRSGHM